MTIGIQTASASNQTFTEALKSAVKWLGHTITKGAKTIKTVSIEIFRSSITFIRTGYGAGTVLGLLAIASITIASVCKIENPTIAKVVRASLYILGGIFVGSAIAMMALYGRLPWI